MRTKISKRGRISVPAEVLKKLQIGPDTQVEWIVEGNTARVIPLPSDPVKIFRGSGKKGAVRRLLKESWAGAKMALRGVFVLDTAALLLFTLSTVQSAFASFFSSA